MHPFRRALPLLLLAAPFAALAACDPEIGDDDDEGPLVAEVSTQECVSGRKWVGGDEESARMHPGGDCMGCHDQSGEGPTYLVAGTVFDLLTEPTDCFGVDGVSVEITDASGNNWSLATNEAGNFYLPEDDGPLVPPYEAAVVMDGMRLAMVTPQSNGNCASCHTAAGSGGAPGRIIVP